MSIGMDEPDPIEIDVRGIPTLVRFHYGFSTYTVQPAGSDYWSETGFHSFSNAWTINAPEVTADDARIFIETIIDKERKGKLTKWWPSYCLQWRQNKRFTDGRDRATTWDQWGPEKHAEHWANHDARQAAAIERMAAEGIDPQEVWRTGR